MPNSEYKHAAGFHLPHNAVSVDEFEFFISVIDINNKEYYLYEELRSLFLEKLVVNNLFHLYHPRMYKRIMNSSEMKKVYIGIQDEKLNYEDLRVLYYSDVETRPSKNFGQNWNEIVRDYVEFFAFVGLLPSYYKGKQKENEKRHYISQTLINYRKSKVSLQSILFNMKFRNASKDYSNYQMYEIRVRPFVLCLKIIEYARQLGYETIDPIVLSGVVKLQKNESLKDLELINFNDRKDNRWSKNQIDEFSRGATFLKQWLNAVLEIPIEKKGRIYVFDIRDFNIEKYSYKEYSVYNGDKFSDLEITPQIINIIKNPSKTNNSHVLNILRQHKLIIGESSNAHVNFDTDLPSRDTALKAYEVEQYSIINFDITEEFIKKAEEDSKEYRRGLTIAQSSDGTAYEEYIFNLLKKFFDEKNINYYGASQIGNRLSDIVIDCSIFHYQETSNLKIVVECKAGSAIKSLDERKELDNISRTLKKSNLNTYDGVWVIIVDSDKIPTQKHGGYRNNSESYSFEEKMLEIQYNTQMQTGKPTLVTAFSYNKFRDFLSNVNSINGIITEQSTKDFWTWSKKFMNKSYVSVQS